MWGTDEMFESLFGIYLTEEPVQHTSISLNEGIIGMRTDLTHN